MENSTEFQFITTMASLIANVTTMENNNDSDVYGSGMGDEYGDGYSEDDYGPYEYYAEGDYIPHFYKVKAKWETVFRGYITFLIAFIVIISNAFMVMVFVRRTARSQTTFILGALAISDAIICFTRLPEAFYFNILGNYVDYVPYRWCLANHGLYIIYQTFRISSNWITALLGFQRCMSVCMPLKFKLIWTMKNTLVALGGILVASILLNIYEMIAIDISELKIYTTPDFTVPLTSGCLRTFSKSLAESAGDQNKSQMIFYIFSGLFYRILPVVILCVTTVVLAYYLRKRSQAFKPKDSCKKNSKDEQYKRITRIIFIIMIVFLIAEIQDGIAFIIYAHELATDKKRQILSEEADIMWDTISATISLLGYACNFWIFFFMSQQFRTALTEMLCAPFAKVRKTGTKINLDSEDNLSDQGSGKTGFSTYSDSTAV